MERPIPDSTTAVTWHIVWQLVPGRDLLADSTLAERIRRRLLEAHHQPGSVLLHYLLLPSEIHLLSRLPGGRSPGDLARAVGNIVARWVREFQGVAGAVFSGPYRACALESDDALRSEFRMLAWRPVSLGLCRVPTYHAASSLRTLLGLSRSQGFDAMAPLLLFGDSVPRAREALCDWIAERPGPVEIRHWELDRGLALAAAAPRDLVAMARPVRGLAAALVAASQPQSVDGALALIERWVLLKLGHPDPPGLAGLASAAGARVRALVACVASRLQLCPAAAVARHYGRSKATLSERMAACRLEPGDRAILGMPPERMVAEAIELARLADPTLPTTALGAPSRA